MGKVLIHVLDLANGRSEHTLKVMLEGLNTDDWQDISQHKVPVSGAHTVLDQDTPMQAGIYKISVNTKDYMEALGKPAPYPYISIVFDLDDTHAVYEISLMLSDSGYNVNIEAQGCAPKTQNTVESYKTSLTK